jgi:hypothetical protein
MILVICDIYQQHIDYALKGLKGLGVCATFIPQGVARRDCCRDAMHRVFTACTPCGV